MKYKVGDKVHVSDGGGAFPTYGDFFKENGLERFRCDWAKGKRLLAGDYTVVATGSHSNCSCRCRYGMLYLLQSEDGKIYISSNSSGYLTLIEEGERKLYASELMELARKEPQKYEGKRYKVVDGAYDCDGHAVTELYVGTDGDFRNKLDGYRVFVGYDTELEEIPQPVSFKEAVKAYSEGKTVECRQDNVATIYSKGHPNKLMKDDDGDPLCPNEILHGEWFIKE